MGCIAGDGERRAPVVVPFAVATMAGLRAQVTALLHLRDPIENPIDPY